MGCGCSSDNSNECCNKQDSLQYLRQQESECCGSDTKKYYAEETAFGLELREVPRELNQYKKHLVDTGIGKRDAEDMMQLVIKHMHDQNEILDQIRKELMNLRKIGGI